AFISRIAADNHRLVFRYLADMPGQFTDIDMSGTPDVPDIAPVLHVAHIKKERGFRFEPAFELLHREGRDRCDILCSFCPCREPAEKHPGKIVIPEPDEMPGDLVEALVEIIDNDDRGFIVKEPAGKGRDPFPPDGDTVRDMSGTKRGWCPYIHDLAPFFTDPVHIADAEIAGKRFAGEQRGSIEIILLHFPEIGGHVRGLFFSCSNKFVAPFLQEGIRLLLVTCR